MADLASLEHARAVAAELGSATPLGVEQLSLVAAAGRVAAAEVVVSGALPPFDGSAMDGWAVRSADVAGASDERPVRLGVTEESRAGRPSAAVLEPGTAIRISTGARLPAGADAIVRSEDADVVDGGVAVRAAVAPGHDVRRAGEDRTLGQVAVRPGERLHAGRIALLAGLGVVSVACRRRPRVALLVTGDELARDGAALGAGHVHDVNGPLLTTLLQAAGAEVVAVVAVADERDATVRALATADADLVVSCGGASVGPHDHVRPALATLGADERVAGLALQPGKPTWLGTLPGATAPRPVLALPGNPGAAVAVATLLAVPLVDAMAGRAVARPRHLPLAEEARGAARRTRALRVSLRPGPDGGCVARVLDGQQPHRLGSLAQTEGFALVPPTERPLPAGSLVEVVPLPGADGR